MTQELPGTDAAAPFRKKQRLLSLDVLRGLTVALMILLNNAGDGSVSYAELRHSVWNGCTLTDLVFPMFLFMVGASIALAFRKRRTTGAPRGAILRQVFARAVTILILGLALNALPFFHLAELRYYGVLQRIALCYLFAAIVYLFGGIRGTATAAAAALAGYWWLLVHVRVPGYGMPGVNIDVLNPQANLAAWLDRMLVPAAHLYHHTFYDPEGLLSTLPALGTTLLGVLAGCWVQTAHTLRARTAALGASGAVCMAAGWMWSYSFPLNKRLWTSSYVLWTAGISLLALALLFWLIDGSPQWRRGLLPWRVFGTNALFAYILSEVSAIVLGAIPVASAENLQQWLFHLLPAWLGPPAFVSMLYSILFVAVCFVPTWGLYRRNVFLKM